MADYRAAIAAYVREQARPPDKYSHQPRLYQLALQIGTELAYDDDILYAAAWLHDLGVFIGHLARQLAEPRIGLLQAFLAGALTEAAGVPL